MEYRNLEKLGLSIIDRKAILIFTAQTRVETISSLNSKEVSKSILKIGVSITPLFQFKSKQKEAIGITD